MLDDEYYYALGIALTAGLVAGEHIVKYLNNRE